MSQSNTTTSISGDPTIPAPPTPTYTAAIKVEDLTGQTLAMLDYIQEQAVKGSWADLGLDATTGVFTIYHIVTEADRAQYPGWLNGVEELWIITKPIKEAE